MKSVLLVMGLLVLSSCQTKTVEEMNYTERKALAAELTQRCYAQGVKAGSPEFDACARVEVQREAAVRRRAAAVEDAQAATPRGPRMCQNFSGNIVCF